MIGSSASFQPRFVDFHCHLDLYPDHEALTAECDHEMIATLAVTTTPKAWSRNRVLADRFPHVHIALGLHPQLMAERADEFRLFERLLPEARFVGEVGLDAGPRFYRSFEIQQRVFERVLRSCAEQGGKVLTIHSVRAVTKVLDCIERYLPAERGRAVLHWFSGTEAEARRAVELGCYFSINAEMLRSPRNRAVAAKLPQHRLLTETDGPFVQYQGRPIRPRDVADTVAELALIHRTTKQDMSLTILANLAEIVTW